jgi:predicted CXXCH cytochrome family protein
MDFGIVALAPPSGNESFSKWVPYIYRTETVAAPTEAWHDWMTATGTEAQQAYRENGGTFTDHGDGSYTYVFAADLSAAVEPVSLNAIPFDRSWTHRVSVMMGGHSGATADANFDFVPDGSDVTMTRNLVETYTCQDCHGANEFHGHGGDRLSIENCVTCHAPGSFDAQSGESLDMKVMVHKIHAGGQLASIPGFDGIVWDDPATIADESADNGEYAIWGYQTSKHEWWKAQFPAVLENCTKCHNGAGAEVDNWKNVPSAAVCESCHDDVDVSAGINHPIPVDNDTLCDDCHQPGTGDPDESAIFVTKAHDWTIKDPRNIPEFSVEMSVSAPANGTHFVAGESPVVSVVLSDDGGPIDHTTVWKDTDGKEGCVEGEPSCPMADGLFDHAYLFVNGPRAKRNPVLTTATYAKVVSSTGPFNLGELEQTELTIKVDNGRDLLLTKNGGTRVDGTITVDLDDGVFGNLAAVTADEIITWLNADAKFAARAIAYLEDVDIVAIRSRNLGEFYAVQLLAGDITNAVFGGDSGMHIIGGYYPRADLTRHEDGADDDPKADWTVGAITYTLDPVDDLVPGTYTASVEITDRGRIDGSNYKTPSVAKVTFNVGQAGEELATAGNCGMCHQGPDGKGYVLDFARHYKIFDNTAVDQCGGCHDYQSGHDYGDWYGGKQISRRVHAVHNGANLTYPNVTVDYNDPVKGRNWDITFPQYIKNCEACHPNGTTSGSWAWDAARIPCSGCHDSDAATAHLKLQTYDPTPQDPWNGDEEESCQTCH